MAARTTMITQPCGKTNSTTHEVDHELLKDKFIPAIIAKWPPCDRVAKFTW